MYVWPSAGGRKGDPVFKWEASFVQEAGRALGACTGEGKCQTQFTFIKLNIVYILMAPWIQAHHIYVRHYDCVEE